MSETKDGLPRRKFITRAGASGLLLGAVGARDAAADTANPGYPLGWYDVTDPRWAGGATPAPSVPYPSQDLAGVPDSRPAIQAALDYAIAHGGHVHVPPGVYRIDPGANGDGLQIQPPTASQPWLPTNVTFAGTGGGKNDTSDANPRLVWTGGKGTQNLLRMGSTQGVIVEKLTFSYNQTTGANAYDERLVRIDWGTRVSDPMRCTFRNCGFCAFRAGAGTAGDLAAALLAAARCIFLTISQCAFNGGQHQILLGLRTDIGEGSTYDNDIVIERCVFNWANDSNIRITSGDAEVVTIRENAFEGVPPNGNVDCSSPGYTYGFSFLRNWIGDAATNGPMLKNLCDAGRGRISGNEFSGLKPGGGPMITWHDYGGNQGGAWTLDTNHFWSSASNITILDNSGSRPNNLLLEGNYFHINAATQGAKVWGGDMGDNVPPPRLAALGNKGSVGTEEAIVDAHNADGVRIQGAIPTVLDTLQHNNLRLGSSRWVTGGQAGAAIYARSSAGGNTNAPELLLQPDSRADSTDRRVAILVGEVPKPAIDAGMTTRGLPRLGFYGHDRVDLPRGTGATTGYTAGSGTQVTVDGRHTGNVGLAAPASLAAGAQAGAGAFTARTCYWQVTARNAAGQTIGSNVVSLAVAQNDAVLLTWNPVPSAAQYSIYRADAQADLAVGPALVATIGYWTSPTTNLFTMTSGTVKVTYTDTGGNLSAGAVPTTNTAYLGYSLGDIVKALKDLGLIAA